MTQFPVHPFRLQRGRADQDGVGVRVFDCVADRRPQQVPAAQFARVDPDPLPQVLEALLEGPHQGVVGRGVGEEDTVVGGGHGGGLLLGCGPWAMARAGRGPRRDGVPGGTGRMPRPARRPSAPPRPDAPALARRRLNPPPAAPGRVRCADRSTRRPRRRAVRAADPTRPPRHCRQVKPQRVLGAPHPSAARALLNPHRRCYLRDRAALGCGAPSPWGRSATV